MREAAAAPPAAPAPAQTAEPVLAPAPSPLPAPAAHVPVQKGPRAAEDGASSAPPPMSEGEAAATAAFAALAAENAAKDRIIAELRDALPGVDAMNCSDLVAAPAMPSPLARPAAAGKSSVRIVVGAAATAALKAWHGAIRPDIRATARSSACRTKVVRFGLSRRFMRNPVGYTLALVFGTTDVDVINALSEKEYLDKINARKRKLGLQAPPSKAELAACCAARGAARVAARVERDEAEAAAAAARRAARDAARVERDEAEAAAAAARRAARDAARVEDEATLARIADRSDLPFKLRPPLTAEERRVKNTAVQAAKRGAAKTANGKAPKYPAAPNCPYAFQAAISNWPGKFRPHLKGIPSGAFKQEPCQTCACWAFRVSQGLIKPAGVYPSALTVVRCAQQVQDDATRPVAFPERIDFKAFEAQAKAQAAGPEKAKRRAAAPAAPKAKKAKALEAAMGSRA